MVSSCNLIILPTYLFRVTRLAVTIYIYIYYMRLVGSGFWLGLVSTEFKICFQITIQKIDVGNRNITMSMI